MSYIPVKMSGNLRGNIFMKHIGRRIRYAITSFLVFVTVFAYTDTDTYAGQTTEINGRTFTNYYITSLNIGPEITDISPDAFVNLHDLKKITVSEGNSKYCSFCNCLYDKEKTELICIPQGLSGASIPNTVKKISPYALEGRSPSFRRTVEKIVEKNSGGGDDKVSKKEDVDEDNDKDAEEKTDDSVRTECADTPLGNTVKAVLSSLSVEGMSREQALRACYDYMMSNCSYKRFTDIFSNGWTNTYALDLFTTGQGNCSSYAAGLAYLAKGLGYDSRVATGKIGSVSGLPTAHSWTEIKIDGQWYIFDSEMDQAKSNKEYYKKTYDNYPSTGLTKELEWSCDF